MKFLGKNNLSEQRPKQHNIHQQRTCLMSEQNKTIQNVKKYLTKCYPTICLNNSQNKTTNTDRGHVWPVDLELFFGSRLVLRQGAYLTFWFFGFETRRIFGFWFWDKAHIWLVRTCGNFLIENHLAPRKLKPNNVYIVSQKNSHFQTNSKVASCILSMGRNVIIFNLFSIWKEEKGSSQVW